MMFDCNVDVPALPLIRSSALLGRTELMTPNKIEYDIGSTIYGQPLRLVRQKDSGGTTMWTLCRDEADQRDDRTFIAGLTRDHITKMAEAVKACAP